mgnify:FL=1
MLRLTIKEIIEKIELEEIFEAVIEDNSFSIKIDSYVPYVCGAVHDGHQFRDELLEYCLHSEYERWYEEDPETKTMINSHPIVLAGLDSRFEYDLNRAPETAVYQDAWGKQLWKEELPLKLRQKSIQKHNAFYEVVDALIAKIESKFGCCIVYDMHSYNWKRWNREVPTWNLGTGNIDNNRFRIEIESWRALLEKMQLPKGIVSSSKINDTFQGNGYFLKHISRKFNNTLVLATEIAKVYCDELTQEIYPEVVLAVENYLKIALKKHANTFYNTHKM